MDMHLNFTFKRALHFSTSAIELLTAFLLVMHSAYNAYC